jgi:hypothetical protein
MTARILEWTWRLSERAAARRYWRAVGADRPLAERAQTLRRASAGAPRKRLES